MIVQPLSEEIEKSWKLNAEAWVSAVRGGTIASRASGTDAAIVDAVKQLRPRTVLDVGCGEGWLSHHLASTGHDVVGIDGSCQLISRASEIPGARFQHLSYASLVADPDRPGGKFDCILCNYSLLDEHITSLLQVLRYLLAPAGSLLIQTLHPATAVQRGELYAAAWKTETFQSMGTFFPCPMPYYFRTFSCWCEELHRAGLQLRACVEPASPDTMIPLSLLLIAERSTPLV